MQPLLRRLALRRIHVHVGSLMLPGGRIHSAQRILTARCTGGCRCAHLESSKGSFKPIQRLVLPFSSHRQVPQGNAGRCDIAVISPIPTLENLPAPASEFPSKRTNDGVELRFYYGFVLGATSCLRCAELTKPSSRAGSSRQCMARCAAAMFPLDNGDSP